MTVGAHALGMYEGIVCERQHEVSVGAHALGMYEGIVCVKV